MTYDKQTLINKLKEIYCKYESLEKRNSTEEPVLKIITELKNVINHIDDIKDYWDYDYFLFENISAAIGCVDQIMNSDDIEYIKRIIAGYLIYDAINNIEFPKLYK